jgi:hypothetical protein
MKFSQRIGKQPVDTSLQTEGMSDALRNSLWNVLDLCVWQLQGFLSCSYDGIARPCNIGDFSQVLWLNFFKKPIDTRPTHPDELLAEIRDFFFGCGWYEVYDFLEFVLKLDLADQLSAALNKVLERELAGFRYVSEAFVPVTDEQEIESIEQALNSGPFAGVAAHLRSALDHLGRKPDPDYRNSIKESISAVESMAKELTSNPKASLGDALSVLESKEMLHPALKRSLSALYGYTSDEEGIRHGMLEVPSISAADAKFMLVACSAFINYLKAKA